jgi:predicted DNA-binding ribbon-helix-helix protein
MFYDFEGAALESPVIKRSVTIDGHKTGVSIEDAFWNDLKEIAYLRRMTLSMLVTEIDKGRQQANLSSAIRLFVLDQIHRNGNSWQYSRARNSRVRKFSKISDDQLPEQES